LLIHPPSVFDFNQRQILFGPISDVVPSTPAFEMYPIGFSSISEFLSKNGFNVRIINLAYRMVRDQKMDVRSYLKKLQARAFGISLHWLPHAHGAVELARMLKELFPDVPVIFGGYSASYFHRELIRYPFVDYVVRGDSTERPLLFLLRALRGEGSIDAVPNLTYRSGTDVVVNDEYHVEADLNGFSNNYLNLFRKAVKYRDIVGMTPIHDWWRYPITMIVTCRGCTHNCAICGGSRFSMRNYLGRDRIAFRDPQRVAKDIVDLSRYTRAPIFVVGDLRQGGDRYAEAVMRGLTGKDVRNHLVLELFDTAPQGFFEMVADAVPNVNFEISPETHDDEVRKRSGKPYTTDAMEQNIRWAMKYGAKKFDVFFMAGISAQDARSVMSTVDYAGSLMEEYGSRLVPFISPLAPFLDPGSSAFEEPEKHGYRVFFRTFDEHLAALSSPSWKYMLNYETEWLTRDEIVAVTYEAGKRLNIHKKRVGMIDGKTHRDVERRIDTDIALLAEIDRRMGSGVSDTASFNDVPGGIDLSALGIVCGKDEIKWPVLRSGFNFLTIGFGIIRETLRRMHTGREGRKT
jgi:B12-binding domain/radical SAM domain protein